MAMSAIRSDTVPFTTPIACWQWCIAAKSPSNSVTSPPFSLPHLPLRNARINRCSSASSNTGQLVKGFVRTLLPPNIAKVSLIKFQG